MIHKKRLLATSTIALALAGTLGSLVYAADKVPTEAEKTQALALVEKAKDLLQSNKIVEAKALNDQALKLAPKLLDVLVQQRQIQNKINEATNPGGTAVTTTPADGTTTTDIPGISEKLNPQQINRIRAYETTTNDKDLAGATDKATLEKFWNDVVMNDPRTRDLTAADREAFYAGKFADQVRQIRETRRNDYIDKLNIKGEPVAMQKFKELNEWVINNCAFQIGCHNQETSKEPFRIHIHGGGTVANIYTNFYLMNKFKTDSAALIDLDKPEESLVVQYGLPAKFAKWTHPAVTGKVIPQRFTSEKDGNFKKLVNDISALNRFAPDFDQILGFAPPETPGDPTSDPAATTTAPAK